MNRCVIYTRVSTDNQTTDNQTLELRKIANQKGYTIIGEYSDVMSGAKGRDKRTGFDNLIKGATRKEFDTILVWSVDRLGRSLKDLWRGCARFYKAERVSCPGGIAFRSGPAPTHTQSGSRGFACTPHQTDRQTEERPTEVRDARGDRLLYLLLGSQTDRQKKAPPKRGTH